MASRKPTTARTTARPVTPPANPAALAIRKQQVTGANEGFVALAGFSKQLEVFFDRAEHLVQRADESLAQAEAFTTPKTAREDELLQVTAKQVNADLAETETHFDQITKPLTKLHKFFTGYRGRATGQLEKAKKIVNGLHSAYTQAEALRVQQENERRRLAAEAKQAQERQAELDRLEAAALKAESKSPDLSKREQAFVDYIVAGMPQPQAARTAGFPPSTAFDNAARLMASKKIQKAIKLAQDARDLRQQAQQVAQAPVEEAEYEVATANVVKAAGAKDVTRWKAVVDNPDLLIEAVIAGTFGIPRDVITVDQVALNKYAQSLHKLIDKWPGVHAESDTRVQ